MSEKILLKLIRGYSASVANEPGSSLLRIFLHYLQDWKSLKTRHSGVVNILLYRIVCDYMKDSIRNFLAEQVGDDDELIASLYEEFCMNVKERYDELLAAASADDFEAIRRAAHSLNGNALVMGDQEFADLAAEVSAGAKQGAMDMCRQTLGKIREEAERCQIAL